MSEVEELIELLNLQEKKGQELTDNVKVLYFLLALDELSKGMSAANAATNAINAIKESLLHGRR